MTIGCHQFIRLSRQNEMIANAHRTVAETEDVAAEITTELARNRQTIMSSRAKVTITFGAFSNLNNADVLCL